ncbi:unnamed protein product [Effrenium voratum]|uniref:Uncharacterized protein n=1 Tax=Effrenium voratum TaxID=2562239 RepID=A0AA36IID5_9DINO|nr:unnamed protein product [Effrenium voratum]
MLRGMCPKLVEVVMKQRAGQEMDTGNSQPMPAADVSAAGSGSVQVSRPAESAELEEQRPLKQPRVEPQKRQKTAAAAGPLTAPPLFAGDVMRVVGGQQLHHMDTHATGVFTNEDAEILEQTWEDWGGSESEDDDLSADADMQTEVERAGSSGGEKPAALIFADIDPDELYFPGIPGVLAFLLHVDDILVGGSEKHCQLMLDALQQRLMDLISCDYIGSTPRKAPVPTGKLPTETHTDPLDEDRSQRYRSATGLLLYLAPDIVQDYVLVGEEEIEEEYVKLHLKEGNKYRMCVHPLQYRQQMMQQQMMQQQMMQQQS